MLDRTADVRAIFSWSYQTLSGEAARLFRLVAGLHPDADAATAAAASVAGVPVSRARALLAELTRASLRTEHAPGRYSCHDLLRAYADELCGTSDSDTDAALHRLLADHYAHTAHAAARHLHVDVFQASTCAAPGPGVAVADFDGPGEALAWLTAERPALLATLRVAADLGLDRQVCQLAQAMFVFLHRQASGVTGPIRSGPPWLPPGGWATRLPLPGCGPAVAADLVFGSGLGASAAVLRQTRAWSSGSACPGLSEGQDLGGAVLPGDIRDVQRVSHPLARTLTDSRAAITQGSHVGVRLCGVSGCRAASAARP
jgi:hypothetical protein